MTSRINFVEIFAKKHGIEFDKYVDFDFDEVKFSDNRHYFMMDILFDIGHEVPVGEIERFYDEFSGLIGQNSFALWYEKRKE